MRQGKHRAAIKLALPALISCTNCHLPTFPHKACAHCGFYKGQKVTK